MYKIKVHWIYKIKVQKNLILDEDSKDRIRRVKVYLIVGWMMLVLTLISGYYSHINLLYLLPLPIFLGGATIYSLLVIRNVSKDL